jgi:hypothetical protein
MTRLKPGLTVAAVCLAFAGCGGDDDTSKDSGATGKTDAPRTAAAQTPADDATARSALIKLSDMPTGWTSEDGDHESKPSKCQAVRDARAATSGRATSAAFNHEPTGQVQQAVYLYADEQETTDHFSALTTPETRKCLGEALEGVIVDGVDKDVKVGDARTGELRIDPVGDESSGSRIYLDYSSKGIDLTLNADLIFVRKGRGLTLITEIDELGEFDSQLREELTTLAYRRLRNALNTTGR